MGTKSDFAPKRRSRIRAARQIRRRIGSMADQYIGTNLPDRVNIGGLSAQIITRSGDVSLRFSGQAVRVTESLNEQTRTLGIVIGVRIPAINRPARQRHLRPGSYCEVTLKSERTASVYLVPRTALMATVYMLSTATNACDGATWKSLFHSATRSLSAVDCKTEIWSLFFRPQSQSTESLSNHKSLAQQSRRPPPSVTPNRFKKSRTLLS